MRTKHHLLATLCLLMGTLSAGAADYSTFLTSARGFTEVTSTDDILADANYYYILVPAETNELIVGIGAYEAKPDWASGETKALRYKSADTDPVTDLSNFFTIEKSGQYIGLRNVVYSADLFQTHDGLGYMYVNTYSDPTLDEWSYLIPHWQSDGYWLFENGKYPASNTEGWYGYMGSWTPGRLAVDEPIALNRLNTDGDPAGHYRLFRITKSDLLSLYSAHKLAQLFTATNSNPIDATWLITNPSFETGDVTGWTYIGREEDNNEFTPRSEYGMTNKEGGFLMNAYQWWGTNLGVTQTAYVPSGVYVLSGTMATWENRTVYFSGNEVSVNETGTGADNGVSVSLNVNVGISGKLTISAGSTGQWWVDGHKDETQTFFKLDNVQLTCKGLYLNGVARPLPNDETTVLEANQWYYYDCNYTTEYWILGILDGMVFCTDGMVLISDITTATPTREMTLNKGRYYFKTTRSNATLKVVAKREINESTSSFKACALNVDGLPESILFVTLNEDGPQSDGTKKISTYLNNKAYDIMGFSEDFNFDTELKSNISGYTWGTHRGKITGLTNDTDGLQFACKNSSVSWATETYVKYNSTASTDGNQYVKKGYRHYDVTFDGQLIDVYITHMDAGDNSDAITSRGKQWKQLTEAINAVDNGRETPRPKIVMGDTNCRWTRDGVKANFLDLLSNNFTASDVWVEFARDGIYPTVGMATIGDKSDLTNYSNYEIVDKIFYINPKAANTVQLVPQSFLIEQDYTYEDGTTPLGDHPPLVVEFKLVKSGNEVPLTLDLADAADNIKAITDMIDARANVTLQGRTLYKNMWNTLCLPFSVTDGNNEDNLSFSGTPIEGATVMELDPQGTYDGHKTGVEGSTLYLYFKDATTISAATPYIVKLAEGSDNIENPEFLGVIPTTSVAGSIQSADGDVTMKGCFSPYEVSSENRSMLYLGDNDLLYYPNDAMTINAFRAYFELNGQFSASTLSRIVMNIDNDELTGITTTDDTNNTDKDDEWYSLDGRKLNGQPTTRGIYVRSTSGSLPTSVYIVKGRK